MSRGTCTRTQSISYSFSKEIDGKTIEGKANITGRCEGDYYYQPMRLTADPYYSEPEDFEVEDIEVEDIEVEIDEYTFGALNESGEEILCEMLAEDDLVTEAIAEAAYEESDWDFDEPDYDDYDD